MQTIDEREFLTWSYSKYIQCKKLEKETKNNKKYYFELGNSFLRIPTILAWFNREREVAEDLYSTGYEEYTGE